MLDCSLSEDKAVLTRTLSKLPVRLAKLTALFSIVVSFAVTAKAQTPEDSFEARLKKAVEVQTKRNEAEEEQQKRLVDHFAAKRVVMAEQDEREMRQSVVDFRERLQSLRQEADDAARA